MTTDVLIPVRPEDLPRDRKVLGLSLIERLEKPARRNGFRAEVISRGGAPGGAPGVFAVVFPRLVLSASGWKKLALAVPGPETALFAGGTDAVALVRTEKKDRVLEALSRCRGPEDWKRDIGSFLTLEAMTLDEKDWAPAAAESDVPFLERWLLRGLVKDTEGFMSKHLERKISLFVTSRLAGLPVSPNAMTLISAGIGLAGAALFLGSGVLLHAAGALLFWLHSVLDGCDGEIARLKFLESRLGGILDFWSDNAVHAAVFSAIAWGLYSRTGSAQALAAGALAVAGTLGSAGWVYAATMAGRDGSGPLFTSATGPAAEGKSGLEKAADFLARRDFIYLVIGLAVFGRIEWFLYLGALGAPAYLAALLLFSRAEKGTCERVRAGTSS
ncbi:MAG: hypothetical protein A2902_06475 [Elusimicrobia bacterium RIFCSPLOWO2_01_FULL_64_13]|nr:MAG: hypothetical protein A2902_06475 [Elusimicrobia bacterium RIFCSPLOWO2_01_FULL_64_13]